jgi:hypothetical protein
MGLAQGVDPLCEIPARIEFTMRAYAENVYLVRNMLRQARLAWSLPDAVYDDAGLILTEFATNASRLYPRQALKVWAAMPEPCVLELAVWDPDPFAAPELKAACEKDESGRGLCLVAGLSAEWGWYPSATTGGKVVWARLVW